MSSNVVSSTGETLRAKLEQQHLLGAVDSLEKSLDTLDSALHGDVPKGVNDKEALVFLPPSRNRFETARNRIAEIVKRIHQYAEEIEEI